MSPAFCPIDGKDDAIRKVSAVYNEGIASGTFTGPTGGATYSDGKWGVAGGIAYARERGDLVAVGQLVGFLECRQRRIRFAPALLDDCQGPIAITLDQWIASAQALLNPYLQVLGGGFQFIPFVQQRAQLDMGGRNGRRLASQLDHLPAQLGCPVEPAVHRLDHPQVGQRRQPRVVVARLLGSLIHVQECSL